MLLEELKRLRQRLGLPDAIHDDAEVTALSRSFRLGKEPSSYVDGLTRCITAPDATDLHRLYACRQLIMVAEMILDAALAEFAYRAVSELPGDTVRHVMTAMMFHTCFGAPTEARHLASVLFEQTQDEPGRLPYVLNSAYTEYRVGEWTVAESRFTHALQLARRGNSRAGEMYSRLFLARLYYSVGRLDAARSWYNRFTELSTEISDEELVWEHNLLGARLSAKEGSITRARSHLEDARSSSFSRLCLPALTIRACDLELRMLEGCEPCATFEVDELLALHGRSRTVGGQDDVVRALYNALRFHGRESEARALVREYLTLYRRDGYPPDSGIAVPAY